VKTKTYKPSGNSKTVLFVVDFFHIGGVCAIASEYTRLLIKQGYRIIVLGLQGDSTHYPEYFKQYFRGARIFVIPNTTWEASHKNLLTTLQFRLRFFYQFIVYTRRIFAKHPVDAVHFNLSWSALAILLFVPRVYTMPRIAAFYNDLAFEYLANNPADNFFGGSVRRMKAYIYYLTQRAVFRFSTKIIAFSTYSLSLLKRFRVSTGKIHVIPAFVGNPQKKIILKKRCEAFQVISVARFEKRKGHSVLLQATKLILNTGRNIHVTFSGPMTGDIKPVLRTYEHLALLSHVTILHATLGKQKTDLMRSGDVFAMSSTSLELFGITVIEALALGVPVICFPNAGAPEVLAPVDRRLIAKNNSVRALAAGIIRLMDMSDSEYNLLQLHCVDAVRQYYSDTAVQQRVLSLYEQES
jgi:glycosyltransferase involved in cell wall biosynthesis